MLVVADLEAGRRRRVVGRDPDPPWQLSDGKYSY